VAPVTDSTPEPPQLTVPWWIVPVDLSQLPVTDDPRLSQPPSALDSESAIWLC
jgi:hypothetical protein